MRKGCAGVLLAALLGTSGCGRRNTPPQNATEAGAPRTAKTAALETGASMLQPKEPIEKISIYLNGFHVSKDDPEMQMEAHHYCNQVNEDVMQCVLFDGNAADARLVGIEYIISGELYTTLPVAEKAYWHPHNYEILSGQLRMPGLPDVAEKETLQGKMNSYGKTWHTWMTGLAGGQADPLPFGPPHLQWSFNRDGEANAAMIAARDQRFDFNSSDERRDRQDLVRLARPQGGVDAVADRFPNAKPIAGVTDNGDHAARPVPTFGMKTAQPSPTAR